MGELDAAGRLQAVSETGLGAEADEVFDRYARMVQALLDVPVALVSLVESGRQFFPGLAGLEGPFGEARETPLSHSFCQHVVATAAPLVIDDARVDPRLAGNLAIAELAVVAYAGMPLTDASGQVLGSLCAIDHEPRNWTESELAMLADLATSCASELRLRVSLNRLERARVTVETAQSEAADSTAGLALLVEVSNALASTLDGRETVSRLLSVLVPRLGDWAIVTDLDESGTLGSAAGRHRDPALAPVMDQVTALQGQLSTENSLIQQVARRGEPMLLSTVDADFLDAATTGGELGALAVRLGLGSLLVVPLRGRGGLLGALTIARRAESLPLTRADLGLATDIGRRAALALENARLHGRQSRAAEVLQRSLLTRMPEPDHMHLVARYLPAAREAQVGGDWYDAFLQPDGATVLVIGDVVGHDIAAAAAMSQVRTLLRGVAYDRGASPAEALSRVDAAMTGLGVETLATVVVARIEQTPDDRASGRRRLRWSNAGHPPPVLQLAVGQVEVLDSEADLMLGVDHTTPRTDHARELPPGSSLFLYTDGLIERRDDDLSHGIARLARALVGRAGVPLHELCDHVLATLLSAGFEDDVAVIAARAYPEGEARPFEAGPEIVRENRPVV